MVNLQFIGSTPVNTQAAQDIERGDLGQIQKRHLDVDTRILTIETDKGTFKFHAPELDQPSKVTTADMASAMQRFESLNSADADFLADVFRLMAMLLEVMKANRTSAREARNVERDRQVAEIGKQVEELKNAAFTALAMGIVSGVVSLGMALWSTRDLLKGIGQQHDVNKATQLSDARAKLDVQTKAVNELQPRFDTAKTNLDAKNLQVQTLESKIQNLEAQKPPNTTALNARDQQLTTARQELQTARAEQQQLKTEVADLQKNLDAAKVLQTQAQEKFDKLNDSASDTVKELSESREKLADASIEADKAMKGLDIRNMANQGLGQILGGLSQTLQGLDQAEATAHEGEARQADYKAQEQVEWMQDMRDAIKTLLDKYQAILQSQGESIRTINRV